MYATERTLGIRVDPLLRSLAAPVPTAAGASMTATDARLTRALGGRESFKIILPG